MIKKFYLKLLMSLLLVALAVPQVQADDVTICSGTELSEFLPIGGYYLDMTGCFGQIIYPAGTLGLSSGDEITSVTFYANNNFTATNNITVRVGETTETTVTSTSATTNRSNMTTVYTGSLPTGSTEVTITFSEPYTYNGDNLIIDIYRNSGTSYCSYGFKWYGVIDNNVTNYYYSGNSYNGQSSFMPKVKITYDSGEVVEYGAKVNTESLNFGQVQANVSSTLNVTLRNTGSNAFTPSVTINGTGFSTTYTSAELASKTSVDIPVTFSPTAAGEFTGTLTINCGSAGTLTVDLTGSAVLEETVCNENTTTSNFLPIYGYYYDNKQINQMIYPAEMLTNLVGKNIKGLTFYTSHEYFYDGKYNVALGMTDQAAFAATPVRITGLTTVATNKVAVAGVTELNIVFDEGFEYTGGNLVIDFEVTEKGSYGSYQTAFQGVNQSTNTSFNSYGSSINTNGTYSATVRQFLPTVKFSYEESAGGSVTVNPSSLTFGGESFYTGQTEDKTFTVTNTTEDAVTITMTGDNVFTFNPSTVAAGATETITVTYAPTAAGNHAATLAVGNKTVTLTGTAVVPPTPTIAANPATLAMNAVVGTPATATVTVTGSNLEGDITVVATGEGFSVAPTTLPAAGGTVTVTYDPAAAGTHTGAITLTSTGAETVSVTLNGTATAPVISGTVTPASLTFSCQEGQTNTATITVENTGNTAFTPAFSGIAAPFSIEAATEIAAGASREFTVTYAPAAVGTHTGALTVTINGTATEVALNGTATEAPEIGELTVAESTSTSTADLSSIAPIYGGKYDQTGWVQMLYPASLLTTAENDMTGKQITKVTFRHSGAPYFSGGAVEVKIGETENANLNSSVAESTLTAVATVSPIGNAFDGSNYLTFEFSKPYVYNGGNLVIQTKVTTKGSADRSKFFGKATSQLGLGNITTLATSYTLNTGNGYSTTFLPQATFTYEKAKGVALVSPEDGVLNFGEVSVKGHKDKYITLKNNGSAAVTPTFGELAYPYSVGDVPASIAAGEEVTIAVTMTPSEDTQDTEYNNVPLTVTFSDGSSMTITINGKSHVNQPTMTTDDFAQIEYTWVDGEGNTQTSNLAEIATEPAQMVELMRKVYMTKEIPGNWYRGYTSAGETSREVAYPAIGSIVYGSNGYDYNDAYGWNIGFGDNVTEHILDNTKKNYKYFNPDEYKPNEDGITLLLVEMNDNEVDANGDLVSEVVTGVANKPTSYESLCSMFGKIFKSVRVVTESRRMGAGEESGTIFKLNADKLNRFFLLAKGRLRMFSLDVDNQTGSYIDASSTGNSYRETEEVGPFFQMFEQLSPVDLSTMAEVVDVYQDLVNMQSYGIHHDCQSIPFISSNNATGHEFNMYGKESQSEDCQDVRDLMITIPARRMQWWYQAAGSDDSRDGVNTEKDMNDMYKNYNKQYVPKMGLFVIKQYEITGEKQENADVYDLNLSWTSNLLEFLPTGYGIYNLYRVVTNADGTKTYVKVVDNLDPNTYSYVDHIPMQQTGQVVTYVVQGQDKEKFLSLQLSNEESFIIPGLDRKEQLRIALNSDYYYSRYDAATKTNNYSNSIIANNTVGTNVKPEYLVNGSQFKFWRATLDENGEVVTPAEPFVVAEVSGYTQTGGGTLTYKDWKDQTDFSGEKYGHGYHANVTTSTISIENGEVKFDGLKLYDNFRVSVEENTHPAQYVYYVTLETAVAFPLNDEGTETSNQARSNTVSVPVYKTGMTMNPLTAQQVEGDVTHSLPAGTTFDLNARYSSKTEILGYYIYRWADTETAANARSIYDEDGEDESPQGQAGNQATYYTVAMNTDYTSQTANFGSDFADVTASFEDNYVFNQATKGDTYTYAPVVELFAPQQAVELQDGSDREDYNTYGGPQQMSAGGVVKLDVQYGDCSEYTWTADGNTYRYYNVFIPINTLSLPGNGDYQVVKVRAWRKVKSELLGEEAGKGYTNRLGYEVGNGYNEFMFDQANVCTTSTVLGADGGNGIFKGTFGAVDVKGGSISEVPLEFVVRVYFTKPSDSKSGEDAQKYYIAEGVATGKLTNQIPTSIFGVESYKVVTGIKYYNVQGIESDVPFQGVNIEVTTYDDGSRTSRKIMK